MITEHAKESYHYVYLLQHRNTGMCYIGVRSCKCKIGQDTYMGSSSVMTKKDKNGCNKIILKRFNTRKEAIAYEVELHEEFGVAKNSFFWNKAKQTSTGFDTNGRVQSEEERQARSETQKKRFRKHGHPCTGLKLSEEHKKKISLGGKGKKHKNHTKIQMSKKASGINNPAFTPWWYEIDGVRTEIFDLTPKQFSEKVGVSFHVIKDRFRKRYEGQPKARDPFKGYIFGRVK